ncbi:NADH-quinone oxidoreductase subunit A [Aeromicrobium panaciterrae]|uniref:NADH-quinone oxidoreductase subunit A n=1 Tax=Aeromicrobium panaciterrae TaxID=363861 RepID=UPI0031DBC806
MGAYLDDYRAVGVIILVGLALAAGMLGANRLFRPTVAARDKTVTYESGVDPIGEGWSQSNVRYFVYAFMYVIFAVDAVFLFPWAVVLEDIGKAAAVEMGIFIGIIVVGLVYAWRKGVLSWTQ